MSTPPPMKQSTKSVYRAKAGLLSFPHLLDYLYCLLASTVLVGQPLPGGALYMVAHISMLGSRLMHPYKLRYLNRRYRITGIVLSAMSAVIALLLLLIYPLRVNMPLLWVLFGVVAIVKLREEISKRINQSCLLRCLRPIQRVLRLIEAEALFFILLALVLFFSLQTDTAWYLLGGFALTSIFGIYSLYHSPPVKTLNKTQESKLEIPPGLNQVNALRAYHSVYAITFTALQVTMVLAYTFIAVTAGDLLLCMGIAFVFTYLPSRIVSRILRSPRNLNRDPSNLLLAGLLLWLVSLILLWKNLTSQNSLWAFISLGFITAGSSIASISLKALHGSMGDIIRFVTDVEDAEFGNNLRELQLSFANLFGQMIALIGLGLLLFFGKDQSAPSGLNLQPTLLVPALILVGSALLAAFRFPLDKQASGKLESFLMLKENGETNKALQLQLEKLLVEVYRRHYGIKLLILVLRPFFYIDLIEKEKVILDKDIPCIFTCNHGELYGPIVTNLFIPYSFRPWVINEMMDRELIADYIYTYTFKRQRWLPESLKLPLSRAVTPALAWIMESLDSIPVYRNTPGELIKTFRASASAMEAGDNLLIFPENPNDPSQEKNGYLRDGIGNFFTGFVSVAQVYQRKTGKSPLFFPIYADKKNRLMRFGKPIRYNAQNNKVDEQRRVSDYLRSEMLRMAAIDQLAPKEEIN
ncbi:MAG: hypothetical protein GX781_01245 [Clostridiales bacterium]|nr:hypothetical protein [Clostridiales bacterium]